MHRTRIYSILISDEHLVTFFKPASTEEVIETLAYQIELLRSADDDDTDDLEETNEQAIARISRCLDVMKACRELTPEDYELEGAIEVTVEGVKVGDVYTDWENVYGAAPDIIPFRSPSSFTDLVADELAEARITHRPIHSLHEGLAVLLEEVDEFKGEVWAKRHNLDRALREVVQVATVAQRLAEDLGLLNRDCVA